MYVHVYGGYSDDWAVAWADVRSVGRAENSSGERSVGRTHEQVNVRAGGRTGGRASGRLARAVCKVLCIKVNSMTH